MLNLLALLFTAIAKVFFADWLASI